MINITNITQKVKLFFLYVVTLYTINNINYSNNKFLNEYTLIEFNTN